MALPLPLNSIEESSLVAAMMGGNHNARNTLIERNLRLVSSRITKYTNILHDYDDRFSIGCEALITAIDTYQPSRNVKLSTYIYACIHNKFMRIHKENQRKRKHIPRMMSLDKTIHDPVSNEHISLVECVPSNDDCPLEALVSKERRSDIQASLRMLPPPQRELLVAKYIYDDKGAQRMVASKYGRTHAWASLEEGRARTACKNYLVNCGV